MIKNQRKGTHIMFDKPISYGYFYFTYAMDVCMIQSPVK